MKKEKTSSRVAAIMIMVAVVSFLTFLVLKLCGVLGWSWWWVCSPLWAPFVLSILAFAFLGMCLMILSYAAKHRK